MRRALNVVLGVLLLSAATARAQAPSGTAGPQQAPPPAGEIRGTVMDGDANTPLARASITVRTKPSGQLVTGAVAKDDGTFRIPGLRPGRYYLRVTSIGYGPVSTPEFAVTPASLNAAAGVIKLSKVAVALGDVEVKGERDAVTIEPDRNTYKAKDVAATANNASEVLDAVPSVSVDGDGKVSLRGNENVVVQINGRPAPMSGTQLGQFLKTLPSAVVDRVEVIPTPSARQDPEGMAGIINIMLKQNVDLGMSGGFNVASATQTGRYNGSGSLGYQVGKWTSFSTYGYSADDRDINGINDRIRLNTTGTPLDYTNQDILGNQVNAGHNLNTTVDYKLTDKNVLTNAINLNLRKFDDNSLANYSLLNSNQSLTDAYARVRNSNVKSYMVDYTLSLKRTIVPRKNEIYTELRFNRSRDNDHTNQSQIFSECPPGAVCTRSGGSTDLELDHADALTQSVNAQLDYTRAFATRSKIETGYKGTGRWLDRDYNVVKDVDGTGVWTPSIDLSNSLNFNEQVQAAYAVLSQGAGKFDLQGGLRAEYARRDFTLKNDNSSYPYNYTSLFPSAIAVYNFNQGTNAKVAYSRRIRRPGTQELNPFPQFFDPQNVFFGNPKLNPEYTDAIELGLTKQGMYGSAQISPFYRRTTDIIRVKINTADVFDGRDVTSVTFQNLATGTSWGTDMNGQLRFGPKGNILGGFNVFKMVTDGGTTTAVGSDAVTWMARLNGTYNPTKLTTLTGSYMYRAPMQIEGGKFNAMQMANFSIRQKIMQDKAAISLRVQDPFNTMGMRIKTGDSNITQITERKFGVRAAFLTFSYNFGQTPKIKPIQPQQQDQPNTGFPSGS